jgi:DNA-binding GntR family transcriptional regulator
MNHHPAIGDTAPTAPADGPRSLNDRVREALREAILAGVFRPGDRLIEGRLAERFGVSRNPVREALKALDSEGLVEIAPRRGAVVARLSTDEAQEVIELRAALEGLGARLAARRLAPEAAARLPDILAAGEAAAEAGDVAELARLNDVFHAAVMEAGSNRYLVDFMRSLRARTHWLFAPVALERAVSSWQEHAAILRAVLDRDEELAALLAARHVLNVGRELMQAPAAGTPGEADGAHPIAADAPGAATTSED